MAIRHIGYGIQDKNGIIVLTEEFDVYFCNDKAFMERRLPGFDKDKTRQAPHKVIRVLIDDGDGE